MTLQEVIHAGYQRITCPEFESGYSLYRKGSYFYKASYYQKEKYIDTEPKNRYAFNIDDIIAEDWVEFILPEEKR